MGRLRVREKDIVAAQRAIFADRRYAALCEASERGRESARLRERATQLSSAGDLEAAWSLFAQAVALFDGEDNGPAAASARFDLAMSLKDREDGVPAVNLAAARTLLTQTLACPERRRSPLPHARDHDALAQVHRRLALLTSGDERDDLLSSALDHSRSARKTAGLTGPVGWSALPGFLHNQANVLRALGRHDDALTASLEADRYLRGALDERGHTVDLRIHPNLRWIVPSSIADLLLSRDNSDDAARAREYAQRAADNQPIGEVDGTIVLSRALERCGTREEAKALLERVDVRSLGDDARLRLAFRLHELDSLERALEVVGFIRHEGHRERHLKLADRAADGVASTMQRATRLEARIRAQLGEDVLAFLTLEATSGLRYVDALVHFAWAPRDPIERELSHRKAQFDQFAVGADTLCQSLRALTSSDAIREASSTALDGLRQMDSAGALDESGRAHVNAMIAALASANPIGELQRCAQNALAQSMRLRRALQRRHPDADEARLGSEMDRDGLGVVLRENADAVFVRVALDAELFAVAVWWDGDGATGASSVIECSSAAEAFATRDPDTAIALARSLDLGPVLRNATRTREPAARRLVLLPSLVGSIVPWAAVQCDGTDLVDCFDAIEQLPSMFPLQHRQAPRRTRSGALLVAPGDAQRTPTQLHDTAFEAPEGAACLFGDSATVNAVQSAARSADVVVFYAHGIHSSDDGHVSQVDPDTDLASVFDVRGGIELADRRLIPTVDQETWLGCDRVELWACESGVNRPTDWLAPLVDDGFGVDIEFHRCGARSTIGTLWPVSELATALIVRRYRQLLAQGESAPRALVRAQRWWKNEMVVELERVLKTTPRGDLTDALRSYLACDPSTVPSLTQLLGPLDARLPMSEEELDATLEPLRSPWSWAAFRFVGVSERRPLGVPPADIDRPLSAAEEQEMDELIASESEEHESWDDWLDGKLAGIHKQVIDARGAVAPPQAIVAARLYAVRRRDRAEHNLLRGLAWLGEAVASTHADRGVASELSSEAAWLWCELLRGELHIEALRAADVRPAPGYVARFAASLDETGGDDRVVLEAWRDRLADPLPSDDATTPAFVGRVAAVLRASPETLEDWRRLAAGVALIEPWMPDDLRADLAAHLDAPLSGLAAVYAAEVASIVLEGTPHTLESILHAPASQRTLARVVHSAFHAAGLLPEQRNRLVDAAINEIEGCYWGALDDDATVAWTATATPGRAWLMAVSATTFGRSHAGAAPEPAANIISALQAGGYWFGTTERAWASMDSATGGDLRSPPTAVAYRRALAASLKDCASAPLSIPCARDADVFAQSPDAFVTEASGSIFEWILVEHASRVLAPHSVRTRTVAFGAEYALAVAGMLAEKGPAFLRSAGDTSDEMVAELPYAAMTRSLVAALRPVRELRRIQDRLQSPGDHDVRLVLVAGVMEAVQVVAIWRQDGGLASASATTEPGVAAMLRVAAPRICAMDELVFVPGGDGSGAARALDEHVRGQVHEAVTAVLSRIRDARTRIVRVFSPSSLTGWSLGCPADVGVAGIVHTCVVAAPAVPAPKNAAGPGLFILGSGHTPALEHLAAHLAGTSRSQVVTYPEEPGSIVLRELEVLRERAPSLSRLVIASARDARTITPSTEAFGLAVDRGIIASLHLADLDLAAKPLVELWYAPGGISEASRIMRGDEPAMPETVRQLLARGARAVVDLAWEVPEAVRWLVFAAFWHRCPLGGDATAADLGSAVAWARARAREEAGNGDGSALRLVRQAAEQLGMAPPRLTAAADAGVLTDERNFAAFRWWEMALTELPQ